MTGDSHGVGNLVVRVGRFAEYPNLSVMTVTHILFEKYSHEMTTDLETRN